MSSHLFSPLVRAGVALATAVVVGCGGVETEDDATLRATLDSLMDEHARAAMRVDVASAASIFAEDGRFMFPGLEPVPGRDSLRRVMESGWAAVRPDSVRFTTVEIFVFGDTVFHSGTYHHTLVPQTGESFQDYGRFLVMWVREQDGSWRIARDFSSGNRPPTSN